MSNTIEITLPSGDIGFVENKRNFCVQGNIFLDHELVLPSLRVTIYDKNGYIVRHVSANGYNQKIYKEIDGLTSYKEELDSKKEKLEAFGFPELIVKDVNNPKESINDATIKCFLNSTCFKCIIVNATDKEHGAIFDSGLNLVNASGKAYRALALGNYKIEVILYDGIEEVAKAYKDFVIGKRDVQLIGRFNPLAHKQRLIDFANRHNISIITDLIPGYLEPYLGKWYYHMGLLQMYRANDLCLFDDVKTIMFNYLIDPTSTSYETELANLQSRNLVGDKDKFECYYYELGEAVFAGIKSNECKFENDKLMHIARVDVVNKLALENTYYFDNRHLKDTNINLDNVIVYKGETIQIMGILKPVQLDPDDFDLKDDNTYEVNNAPDIIRYTFKWDDNEEVFERHCLLERIDRESIGKSVFEFYNLIKIKDEWVNKEIKVSVNVIDKKGLLMPYYQEFIINVH